MTTERNADAAEAVHSWSTQGRPERPSGRIICSDDRTGSLPFIACSLFSRRATDVFYAPGISGASEIVAIINSVDRPVNAGLHPHGPTVQQRPTFKEHHISVGSSFAYTAIGALAQAGRDELAGSMDGLFGRVTVGRGHGQRGRPAADQLRAEAPDTIFRDRDKPAQRPGGHTCRPRAHTASLKPARTLDAE